MREATLKISGFKPAAAATAPATNQNRSNTPTGMSNLSARRWSHSEKGRPSLRDADHVVAFDHPPTKKKMGIT